MGKNKVTRHHRNCADNKARNCAQKKARRRAEKRARKLLQSRRFFNEFLLAVRKEGLVGEEQNALTLFIVAVSRILARPLNAFVKGRSSAGKNYLVTRILLLMPKSEVVEISSASDKAWNYSRSDLRHRVVYLQEDPFSHIESSRNMASWS
jgi:hypothetical protein